MEIREYYDAFAGIIFIQNRRAMFSGRKSGNCGRDKKIRARLTNYADGFKDFQIPTLLPKFCLTTVDACQCLVMQLHETMKVRV